MTMTTTNPGLEALLGAIGDGRPRWQYRAACLGMETDLFYPSRGESTAEARSVCQDCDVQAECFAHAIGNREKHGVWGDTSERQRRRIRRQLRQPGAAQ